MPSVSEHWASSLPSDNNIVIILFTLLSVDTRHTRDHETLFLLLLLFILFGPLGDQSPVARQHDIVGVEFFNVLNSTGSIVQKDFEGFWGNALSDFLLPLKDEGCWCNDKGRSSRAWSR